jgi:hypothetical protein
MTTPAPPVTEPAPSAMTCPGEPGRAVCHLSAQDPQVRLRRVPSFSRGGFAVV